MPHNPLKKNHKPNRRKTKQYIQKIFSLQIQNHKQEEIYLNYSQAQIQQLLEKKRQKSNRQVQIEQSERKQNSCNPNNISEYQQTQNHLQQPRISQRLSHLNRCQFNNMNKKKKAISPQVRANSSSTSKQKNNQFYSRKYPPIAQKIQMPQPPLNPIKVRNQIFGQQCNNSDINILEIDKEAEYILAEIEKGIEDECSKQRRKIKQLIGQLQENEHPLVSWIQSDKTFTDQNSELEFVMNNKFQLIYRQPKN